MNEIFLFANPIAGRGRGGGISARIARQLRRAGFHARVFRCAIDDISDEELETDDPPAAAITVGGDGTLRAVAQRLLEFSDHDASRVPPLLVVPLGTANLMARHLKLAWNDSEEEIVAAIENQKIVALDAGRANEKLFLLMAGVGIDAAVVHELDRLRSGPIDLTSYAMPALLALQQYDYGSLRVEVDGRQLLKHQPAMVFVGNVPEYGTGFPILTKAKSDDGMLDVCILPCRSRLDVLRLLMATATGDHLHEEGVIYTKGQSIRIESTQRVPLQIDGEAAGHTPIAIDLLPSRLRFIVP
ncbi:MAG TPA: diacylglycerol kinase family protein [Tepidisphaeraceae bacterium]|nr:diacylglycerol kinase family protein [Tepidisphaeraceae bacterium]